MSAKAIGSFTPFHARDDFDRIDARERRFNAVVLRIAFGERSGGVHLNPAPSALGMKLRRHRYRRRSNSRIGKRGVLRRKVAADDGLLDEVIVAAVESDQAGVEPLAANASPLRSSRSFPASGPDWRSSYTLRGVCESGVHLRRRRRFEALRRIHEEIQLFGEAHNTASFGDTSESSCPVGSRDKERIVLWVDLVIVPAQRRIHRHAAEGELILYERAGEVWSVVGNACEGNVSPAGGTVPVRKLSCLVIE